MGVTGNYRRNDKKMKMVLTALFTTFLFVILSAGDKMVIPDGIRYKKAPDEVNNQAKKILERLFSGKISDKEAISCFENKLLICGPGLWRDIKKDNAVSKLTKGKVDFRVPCLNSDGSIKEVKTYEGKIFQSPDEVLVFWKAFVARTEFAGLKIRKLNPTELKLYWAMIPYDITEPIFILDSKKHKILVAFVSPKDLKIAWIDDYQHVKFKKNKAPDKENSKN